MDHHADFATFDPLAALEAEYAAVITHSRRISNHYSVVKLDDAESTGSESEDIESATDEGFENYALLPSSPCTSDTEAFEMLVEEHDGVRREQDNVEHTQIKLKAEELPLKRESIRLEESKRLAIMQSMQQVKLCPPPWAQGTNITDEELLKLVQQQLGLMNKVE
ncbi:unnamed protein product [Peronospora belbahrii]|uniref:Uncharacterized protein n=1 Tax=Peronospora belbahrii TaxID=622444 RepID=A0AAU9L1U4_9STRA|nr:unnamed protein product [Peronospora belbahrii]CAH0517483.1 unnamed protein product [Peronospora belbahrii]